MNADYKACDKQGYHQFKTPAWSDVYDDVYGSFEVFWGDEPLNHGEPDDPVQGAGWYWWACFPGCTPDSDDQVNGPFATSQEAYDNAQERA